jgi:hypothetical protein
MVDDVWSMSPFLLHEVSVDEVLLRKSMRVAVSTGAPYCRQKMCEPRMYHGIDVSVCLPSFRDCNGVPSIASVHHAGTSGAPMTRVCLRVDEGRRFLIDAFDLYLLQYHNPYQ